jgi:hypothetical protein
MHLSENCKQGRLPKRFPVGSTFVVEGCGVEDGHLRVFSRYVVLPGGRRINVGGDFGGSGTAGTRRRARKRDENQVPTPKKHHSTRAKKLWRLLERVAGAAVEGQMPGEAPQPLTLNHPVSNPGRISGRGSSFYGEAVALTNRWP